MTRDEDALWQEIVDHYDDTAELDDGHLESETRADSADEPSDGPQSQLFVFPDPEPAEEPSVEEPEPTSWEDEGRFVPPPPARIPLAEPPRMVAWLGVFLAPVIALAALVLGHPFRGILALLLVAWFVGGFVYLVRTMPNEPRDPWDDGSRI